MCRNSRSVINLRSARDSRCSNKHRPLYAIRFHSLTHSREKNHLSNSNRRPIMRLLIAERTSHSAATGRNHMHLRVHRQIQQRRCLLHTHQRLLMAMSVQPNLCRHIAELLFRNPSCLHLAHQKLIKQQTVLCQFFSSLSPFTIRHQLRIFVAESKDARWFNAHQRSLVAHQIFQQPDILLRITSRHTQTTLRDGCTTTLCMLRHNHFIPQPVHQPYKRLYQLRLLILRKLIQKQIYPLLKSKI